MIKVGILILSILPFSAFCSQPVSSSNLLKACNGNILSLDENEQIEVSKIYERMKPEEITACKERDDEYRNYIIKKYNSASGVSVNR